MSHSKAKSLLLCVMVVHACKDPTSESSKKKAAEVAPPTFTSIVTSADLPNPGNGVILSAEDLAQLINSESYFLNLAPYVEPQANCLSDAIGNTPISATKNGTFAVKISTGNLASCVQSLQPPQAASTPVTTFNIQMSIQYYCPEIDLSTLNGLPLAVAARTIGHSNTPCLKDARSLAETLITEQSAVMDSSGVLRQVSKKRAFRLGLGDGKPCVKPSAPAQPATCTSTDASIAVEQPPSDNAPNSYSLLTDVNLVGDQNGQYYASGSITFAYNNWQGSMVYTGPATPPTWQARSSQGQSTGGTFNYTPISKLPAGNQVKTSGSVMVRELERSWLKLLHVM